MKVAIKTLGCKVNQYESEMLKERFIDRGYTLAELDDEADVFVINTCSVTNLSDRKARQMIRAAKKASPNSTVVVTGCYSQIKPAEVLALDEVDIVTGTNHKAEIVDLVEKHRSEKLGVFTGGDEKLHKIDSYEDLLKSEYVETGVITAMENRTRAYIKIQEGCNRYCSYCIIPFARGKIRSRSLESIVEEAKGLLEKGFRELVLTGINTALYGMEAGLKELGLVCVLEELDKLPYDFRIRLSSLEPTVVNFKQVSSLLKFKKLCPHLHLSVQSGSDKIIKAMNRHYSRQDYLNIVKMLRTHDSGFGITTDMIVGFPGETEDDFLESLRLIEEACFVKVHAFRFSKRTGTAAENMQGQLSGSVKTERVQKLITFSQNITKEFLIAQVGTKRRILCESYGDGYLQGYTENYIRAYIKIDESADKYIGEFLPVKMKETFLDGMIADIIM